MTSLPQDDLIESFWRCFLDRRVDLESLTSIADPTYDEILDALRNIDTGLCCEFCSTPGVNEFVVSADGDKELFPLVDEIVSRAPAIENWTIHALKPKRGFPLTTRWAGVSLNISGVLVRPVFQRETGQLGIHLYVEGLQPTTETDIHNALLRAIDSGLGERRFAELINATWIHPMSEITLGMNTFELAHLDEYLDHWGRTAGSECYTPVEPR